MLPRFTIKTTQNKRFILVILSVIAQQSLVFVWLFDGTVANSPKGSVTKVARG